MQNKTPLENYDIIVVGGGHAGCEAAASSARLGCKTLLLTMYIDLLAHMPCNPSVGGTARGQMVREIDALGGLMGKIADRCAVHSRLLNHTKGPAVQSPRCQVDRFVYRNEMQRELMRIDNLFLKQGEVSNLILEDNKIKGIITKDMRFYTAKAVILTAGTFLGGEVHIGQNSQVSGRAGETASVELSKSLQQLNLDIKRFKTGTPPRVTKRSLDFTKFEIQDADENPTKFSFTAQKTLVNSKHCWMAYTTEQTQQIVADNIKSSSLYGGQIEGTGVRYCPSFEDKVVRFADKTRHHIFIEPEGDRSEELYLNGLSNSLPPEIQDKMLRSIPGFENIEVTRYAYAIEYDYVLPYQLKRTMELAKFNGLYLAGQIVGSSGYEEAAAQGLVAGVNAVHKLQNKKPFVLERSEAYIGVLVDDLVTKDIQEPYRMFTSSAEYRILLRHDNADIRLYDTACRVGLIDDNFKEKTKSKIKAIKDLTSQIEGRWIEGKEAVNLLNMPKAKLTDLIEKLSIEKAKYADDVIKHVEIELKYRTYIKRQLAQVERNLKMERVNLPDDLDYDKVDGLKNEAREKLNKLRPADLGQASRIAGISPADIAILTVYMRGIKKLPRKV